MASYEDINHVSVTGNVCLDPILRATKSGNAVLQIRIASNRSVKDQSGQWTTVPNYFDCSIFGARADALSRVITKGQKLAIDGELRYHQWTDKQGQKRNKVEIIPDKLVFLSKPKNHEQQGNGDGIDYYQPPHEYVNDDQQQPDLYPEPMPF